MTSLATADRDVRDILIREKADKSLIKLDSDFYQLVKTHLGILEEMWTGNKRGDPDVERSYHKWKVVRDNVSDIFLNRLRKILTLVNRKIDGREPNLGNLLPEEKNLFATLVFTVKKTRSVMVDISEEERSIVEDMLDLVRSDPEGKMLLSEKTHDWESRNQAIFSSEPEPGASLDLEKGHPLNGEYLRDFDDVEEPARTEEDSFIEPYEEYSSEDLGEGDIELEGGMEEQDRGKQGSGEGYENRIHEVIGGEREDGGSNEADDHLGDDAGIGEGGEGGIGEGGEDGIGEGREGGIGEGGEDGIGEGREVDIGEGGEGDSNREGVEDERVGNEDDQVHQRTTGVEEAFGIGDGKEQLPEGGNGDNDDGKPKERPPISMTIRVLKDTGEFMSVDGNTYNLKKDEVVSFPFHVANVLVAAEKAERIE